MRLKMQAALALICLTAAPAIWAQQASEAAGEGKTPSLAERQERVESPAIFKVRSNLVLAPVVVRNSRGEAVGGLKRENFVLYDNGKPVPIKVFEVETPSSRRAKQAEGDAGQAPAEDATATVPSRYVAYVFDDLHMDFGQVGGIRKALLRQLQSAKRPGDRIALYTTSGAQMVEFTDDVGAIVAALGKVSGNPDTALRRAECPHLNFLVAQQIDRFDEAAGQAFDYAYMEAQLCTPQTTSSVGSTNNQSQAPNSKRDPNYSFIYASIRREVSYVLGRARSDGDKVTGLLRAVMRRMSAMPGERIAIVASEGFQLQDKAPMSEIIDQATRAHVLVNSINSRGLVVDAPEGDASMPETFAPSPGLTIKRQFFASQNQSEQNESLRELAESTGGQFSGDNDFDGALTRAAGAPEYTYLLAFSPQNLKHDGSYHKLKVQLVGARGLSAQARHGYNAPLSDANPDEEMKSAVREAMFSQEEVREIPLSLQTQFYKTGDYKATIGMLLSADLGALPMKHADGRYSDNLGFYAAIFDANGNYVAGMGKRIELHLKEETARRLNSKIVVRGSLDVQSGSYLLRVVLRDTEGEQISAISRTIRIP